MSDKNLLFRAWSIGEIQLCVKITRLMLWAVRLLEMIEGMKFQRI